MRGKVKYSIFQFHNKAKHCFDSRMEKEIQKTKMPNILPGKWEWHRNHRNSEYMATHGGQRLSLGPAQSRAFLTHVSKTFRAAQTFWATYSNS